MLTGQLGGETITAPDYKIKAAFIYNFAKLTEWPTDAFESDSSPIHIGVVGADSLAAYLDEEVKGRSIKGRTLTVTRFKPSLLVTNCHVLFVGAAASDHNDPIPPAVRYRPILTVGESQKFARAGGIITLERNGSALQFGVSQSAAAKARVRLSSKLLALARNKSEEARP